MQSPLPFYLLFALAVTLSVQLVGVYLVFASLIIPALAIRNMRSQALSWGYLIGVLGYLAGLIFSSWLDVPAGAMIVWTLTLSSVIAYFLLSLGTVTK